MLLGAMGVHWLRLCVRLTWMWCSDAWRSFLVEAGFQDIGDACSPSFGAGHLWKKVSVVAMDG